MLVAFETSASTSFTLGVEGITRKKESILRLAFSLLITGTESDRDMRLPPFTWKKE